VDPAAEHRLRRGVTRLEEARCPQPLVDPDHFHAPYDKRMAIENFNVFGAEVDGRVDVAQAVGSTETAMYIYDVQPGRGASPYHYEYVEEYLLVLDGTVVVRVPDGERTLERGDLVCFPPGPAGAHKVKNPGSSAARVMLFSSARLPAVSVYPDSDKVGVWPDDATELIFRRSTAVSWSDDEEEYELTP
jgi:uncharacterized cupin superfamily protein